MKSWMQEHKPEILTGFGFVLMFLIGFGTGHRQTPLQREKLTNPASKQNYTIKSTTTTAQTGLETPTDALGETTTTQTKSTQTKATATKPKVAGECIVKGNISATSKIYHVAGGAFYARTKAEQCFNTEAEAQAAGFRKSSR